MVTSHRYTPSYYRATGITDKPFWPYQPEAQTNSPASAGKTTGTTAAGSAPAAATPVAGKQDQRTASRHANIATKQKTVDR